MRSVEFHPEAQDEFIAAARYFEDKTENLGVEFISLVQHTYERVAEYPNIGRRFGRRIHRVLVPRFPYALLYRVEPRRIYVVATMHLSRRPGYLAFETLSMVLPNNAFELTGASVVAGIGAARRHGSRGAVIAGSLASSGTEKATVARLYANDA